MTATQPNILFIITDQQHHRMMSCAGNAYVQTPAMDSLAEQGVRFTHAFCTNPVCAPSRFSFFTGRMPSEIGVTGNVNDVEMDPAIPAGGLGHLLRAAGYNCVYGGKQHMPGLSSEDVGFAQACDNDRDGLADWAAEFLTQPQEQPFCLVTSFINPHDICFMGIRDSQQTEGEKWLIGRSHAELAALDEALALPEGMDEETFFATVCPPLPPNFGPQCDEPAGLTESIRNEAFRHNARENWSARRWRLHRWAYAKLTEKVDAQIGRVLAALDAGEHAANTIVVFTSDHGDHDGAHGLEHKSTHYDEACRVPLIVRQPSGPAGTVCDALVSNGLDLLPTFCDLAGANWPEDLLGRSLRPLLGDGQADDWREVVPIETQLGHGVTDGRFHYARYAGDSGEQLYDRTWDPGQLRNFIDCPHRQQPLERLRADYDAYWPNGPDGQG